MCEATIKTEVIETFLKELNKVFEVGMNILCPKD
jgi:hypothetical protein